MRGRIPSHYVFGGYNASGRGVCEGFGVATLDDAVTDGIQHRIDLVLDPEEVRSAAQGHAVPVPESADAVPQLQARLVRDAKADRPSGGGVDSGIRAVRSVGPALVGLDRERERLERDLAATQARDFTPTGIEVIVHELVAALARLRDVLETGEPEERKAVV